MNKIYNYFVKLFKEFDVFISIIHEFEIICYNYLASWGNLDPSSDIS